MYESIHNAVYWLASGRVGQPSTARGTSRTLYKATKQTYNSNKQNKKQ